MYQPLCTVEPLLFQHLKIWAGWPSQPLNICESPWGIHPVCWTIFKIIYYLKPPTSIIIEGVCILMYAYMYIVGYIYICIYICVCLLPLYSYDTLWYSHVTCLSPQSCPIKPSSSMGYPYILLVIPCYPSIFRSVISICCCFSIYRSPFFHPRPDLPLKPASRSSKFSMDSRSFRPSTSPHCTSVADFYKGKPVNR
jgi:hypothetical protein